MHHTDPSSAYYQYYQNPNNPRSTPTTSAVSASAPPVYPATNPDYYSQYPDLNPTSYPAQQPYSFPHLNSQFYPYDQPNNPHPPNYDFNPTRTNPNPNPDFSNYNQAAVNYDYATGPKIKPDYDDQGLYGEGVYQYTGNDKEPYGAHGTGSSGALMSRVVFDDYGRAIGGEKGNGSGPPRVVKAALKEEERESDVAGGLQKFRVRMLSEGAGQSDMDVLCQIGLDGIRILDPATSRTLRIYSLEAVTRWEVLDSYIFSFWAKTTIDLEPKRIRLKSNSYTSNNMLDMVTAASFQLKEIGDTKKPSDAVKISEQTSEKKKGFPDWINLMKPRNEEKDYWVPDEAVNQCTACRSDFNAFNRKHHCRNCGDIFCDKCTQGRIELTADENDVPVRVCDRCLAEVTQRLANVKESSGKVAMLQSHADLAKKLKEEMDKNRKTSTGLTSSESGKRMKDVACPTCTVHLQVQVPSSGSETIECSVCQHPFLVHA